MRGLGLCWIGCEVWLLLGFLGRGCCGVDLHTMLIVVLVFGVRLLLHVCCGAVDWVLFLTLDLDLFWWYGW